VIMPDVVIPEAVTIEFAIVDSGALLHTGNNYIGTRENILLVPGKEIK
jgi:ADP-glucose pyrophosphorylase